MSDAALDACQTEDTKGKVTCDATTKDNVFGLGNQMSSSEYVGKDRPDKLCDQVSEAVMDARMVDDPKSQVACEPATQDNVVLYGSLNEDQPDTLSVQVSDVALDACMVEDPKKQGGLRDCIKGPPAQAL